MEELKEIGGRSSRRYWHVEADQQALPLERLDRLVGDALGGFAHNLAMTLRAERACDPRHEEFEIVVYFGHCSDR
jgi:hypothetical protein